MTLSPPISSRRKTTGRSPAIAHGLGVKLDLLLEARQLGRDHELQFGAEQPDARRAGIVQHRQVGDQPRIVQQRDLDAVLGDRRLVLERGVMGAPLGRDADLVDIGLLDIGRRAQMHQCPPRHRR